MKVAPSEKAVEALAAHARQRSMDSRRRIQRALRDLRSKDQTININVVAKKAKVSRKTIYSHPDLRAQIQAHSRVRAVPVDHPTPVEDSIVTALRSQLTAKDSEIKRLREEIRRQETRIATLYGALESKSVSNPDHTP